MEIKIKDIQKVSTLTGEMKVPVGNAGDNGSYTASIDQIKAYVQPNLSNYVTGSQLESKGYTTLREVQSQGYVNGDAITEIKNDVDGKVDINVFNRDITALRNSIPTDTEELIFTDADGNKLHMNFYINRG